MRTLELFYEWLFYVIPLVKSVFYLFYWLLLHFYMLGLWWMGDCSQPCPRSTLRHRPRCGKHSETNPTRLIAINSLPPPWAFVISANVCALAQKCDRVMIPCVMDVRPRGSLPWQVSSSSASWKDSWQYQGTLWPSKAGLPLRFCHFQQHITPRIDNVAAAEKGLVISTSSMADPVSHGSFTVNQEIM